MQNHFQICLQCSYSKYHSLSHVDWKRQLCIELILIEGFFFISWLKLVHETIEFQGFWVASFFLVEIVLKEIHLQKANGWPECFPPYSVNASFLLPIKQSSQLYHLSLHWSCHLQLHYWIPSCSQHITKFFISRIWNMSSFLKRPHSSLVIHLAEIVTDV